MSLPIIRSGYAKRSQVYGRRRNELSRTVRMNATACYLCGQVFELDDIIEAHHVQSVASGGPDILDNLRATHRTCNRRHG